ncbi:MAG: recombinase family protein [Bacilli bacterium]|nr:recombinase family protein [Bacilli bacterium]
MIKVGVYCRLSDEDRYKKNKNDDSESIVNQKSMLIKYALDQGWDIVDIYSDDDYSGAGVERPDFNRLINDCENGRINLVLCKTQSRFSRDMEVIEKYLHNKFIEWGVRFVSIVDNADTDNEANKKSRQINGLVNEWYLEDLSNNVKKSLKNKREDGLYMGSFAPYGYKKDPNDKHKLIIDEEVSYVVREIFEKYKNGLGYHKICASLNERGILCPSLYKKSIGSNFVCCNFDYKTTGLWTHDTIAGILKNETYIGNLVQGKRTNVSYKNHKSKKVPEQEWCRCENTHEAIIDMETWHVVQRRIKNHHRPVSDGKVHILSSKVYCKECGRIFMRNLSNVKGENHTIVKRAYLQCKGKKKYHTCDNDRAIRYDVLEQFVLDSINDLLKKCNKELLKDEYNETIRKQNRKDTLITNLNKEKATYEKKLNESKLYFKNLYTDKLKNIISEEDFSMLRDEYIKDVESFQERIEEIQKELNTIENKEENVSNIESILKKYKHIKKLTRIIVDEFIDKIYIGKLDKNTKTREIKIVWNLDL